MKFFFPDSQDLVSPSYDFLRDEYSAHRVRQRDDRYAHEVLDRAPYHGILVSKSIVDGSIKGAGKYSTAQRARLYRLGVHQFFRLPAGRRGARRQRRVQLRRRSGSSGHAGETLDFYEECGFDAGVSADHVIFGFTEDPRERRRRPRLGVTPSTHPPTGRGVHRARAAIDGSAVEPVGAAQGWSPETLRRQRHAHSRIWATSASRSAAWCRSRPVRSSRASRGSRTS